MSETSPPDWTVRLAVLSTGERVPLLVRGLFGLPDPEVAEFVVTQLRAKGRAARTISSTLRAIAEGLSHLQRKGLSLEERIAAGTYLSAQELTALATTFKRGKRGLNIGGTEAASKYSRFVSYILWKAEAVVGRASSEISFERARSAMKRFKVRAAAVAPRSETPLQSPDATGGLTPTKREILLGIIHPDDPRNPWADASLRVRNQAMVILAYELGPRAGDVLTLKRAALEAPDLARGLTPWVERQVDEAKLPAWQRAVYCTVLSTHAGRFSSQSHDHWARRALSEFCDQLSPLERAQMAVTVLPWPPTPAQGEQALEQLLAAREYVGAGLSPLQRTRRAAQTVEFVRPYFVRSLDAPNADLVLRGLQAWYGQQWPQDHLDPDTILLNVPFGMTGATQVFAGRRKFSAGDTQPRLERLVRAMDAFLSIYTTVAFADNQITQVPERPGVPQAGQSQLLEALREAYCVPGLEVEGEPSAQLQLPPEGHPLQAVQLACWNRTWPIAASLGRPRPDRAPRQVLFWGGATITSPMEEEMVRHAFQRTGAIVHTVPSAQCTPATFLQHYTDPKYDVIWVASHGEFDHWAPHAVRLQLADDGASISLEDLWEVAPMSAQRRLLVLNICDGARFAEPGMLPRVGLAAGLATPAQAAISHLWPILPYPSATFGAYLAHFLSQGAQYFDAYVATLLALAKPAVACALELEKLYGCRLELTERLAAQSADFSGIDTWGSAAFFQ